MEKVTYLNRGPQPIGSLAEDIIQPLNPEGFIEFQLRQTVYDAIQELGREKVMEIVKEAAE